MFSCFGGARQAHAWQQVRCSAAWDILVMHACTAMPDSAQQSLQHNVASPVNPRPLGSTQDDIPPSTGDHLEVREYQRLSPLTPSSKALQSLDKVKRGDCIVAFSRREVHALKRRIEHQGNHKCCVVWPPGTWHCPRHHLWYCVNGVLIVAAPLVVTWRCIRTATRPTSRFSDSFSFVHIPASPASLLAADHASQTCSPPPAAWPYAGVRCTTPGCALTASHAF